MLSWSLERKILQLKYTWKISRNASDEKINFFVMVSDGKYSGSGEAAPNIRYYETPGKIEAQFNEFLSGDPGQFSSIDELQEYLSRFTLPNSLRFAVESAFVHFLSRKYKKSVSELLGIPVCRMIHTMYSFPIMEPGKLKNFFEEQRLSRFEMVKVKINSENGYDLLKEVPRITHQPLAVDANESFKNVEELIRFLEKIKNITVSFIEQPMHSSMNDEYVYLKKYSPFPLIADESVTHEADFDLIQKQFHGVNMKLMKAGGYRNGIRILEETKKRGMKTMIGCMVETSLGISSAINLCANIDFVDLDGSLILKEDPFGLIEERDGELRLVTGEE